MVGGVTSSESSGNRHSSREKRAVTLMSVQKQISSSILIELYYLYNIFNIIYSLEYLEYVFKIRLIYTIMFSIKIMFFKSFELLV